MVLKSSFDPKIVWRLPKGDVPFKKNDASIFNRHKLTLAIFIKCYVEIEKLS